MQSGAHLPELPVAPAGEDSGRQAEAQRRAARAAHASLLPRAMHFLSKGPEAHFQMMRAPWLLPVATLHVAAFHIQTRWRGRRLLRAARGEPLTASGSDLPTMSATLDLPSERPAMPIHVAYEHYVQRVKSHRRRHAAQLLARGRSFGGMYGAGGANTASEAQHAAEAEQQTASIRTPGLIEFDEQLAQHPKWVLRELQALQTLDGYAATRIGAWWRGTHNKWWFWLRFLRPRRVVYQVAALELQQVLSAWMRRRRGSRWQAAWRNRRWLHYRDMGYNKNPTRRQEMQLAAHRRFRPSWMVWDYRAWQIQGVWRNYRDRRVAGFLARLVTRFNASGDTRAVLAGVAAGEALLADAASKLIVRFRLGGGPGVWPPVLVYKIGTAAPVCDVGAFAPRDYAAVEQRRAALPAQAATLKQLRSANPRQFRSELGEAVDAALDAPLNPQMVDDKALSKADGWYQRETRNTWRMVALGKVLSSKQAAQFLPDMPVPVTVSSSAGLAQGGKVRSVRSSIPSNRCKHDVAWHHDPSQRRRNRAAAHVHAKNRWIEKMKALYMNQGVRSSPSEARMVPDDTEEDGYADESASRQEHKGGEGADGVRFAESKGWYTEVGVDRQGVHAFESALGDEDDEELLAWMGAIDLDAYDEYVTQWHAVGTTGPCEPSSATDRTRAEPGSTSHDFKRLSSTVSGPQSLPRHAPLQPAVAAATAAEEAHFASLDARVAEHEAALAELGVNLSPNAHGTGVTSASLLHDEQFPGGRRAPSPPSAALGHAMARRTTREDAGGQAFPRPPPSRGPPGNSPGGARRPYATGTTNRTENRPGRGLQHRVQHADVIAGLQIPTGLLPGQDTLKLPALQSSIVGTTEMAFNQSS